MNTTKITDKAERKKIKRAARKKAAPKADAADRTAERTSSELARSTSACCSSGAGFHTGAHRAPALSTGRPSIQCPIVRT